LDTRLIAVGAAAAIGLVVGGALWAVSGGKAQGQGLSALGERLDRVSTRVRSGLDRPSDALSQALARPIFGGPIVSGDQKDVTIQLAGVVRSPGRIAALLSIGGAPAQWMSVGEEQAGVSLQAISSGGVTLMTPAGEREVLLGMPSGSAPDGAPLGFRSPPPPASAPGLN
jgi:hypothetical protein